jgi:hypothetical protein
MVSGDGKFDRRSACEAPDDGRTGLKGGKKAFATICAKPETPSGFSISTRCNQLILNNKAT